MNKHVPFSRLSILSAVLFLSFGTAFAVSGGETRFVEPTTLRDYHPFRPVEPIERWEARQKQIRARALLASGLLPLPEKTPLAARRFGAVEGDGFQVERVFFESFPGHFVTGSLFTPTGESALLGLVEGKRPGVLCPHGHWNEGRFYDLLEQRGERAVRQEIAIGAERFEAAARNPMVARCVQLARMGCVVFLYDMIGYADSTQFAEHRRGPREIMDRMEGGEWGFVSPQATLRLQSNFGLQTWNSVRALDFLEELDEVDSGRLLVTGASGGATQTMILAAIDERVDAAFPAVMVSTAMQGGCTCENAHYLRIGQGNMDIGAALAPKPLGLTAADDWTIELEEKGHPDLVSLYERLGAAGNYEAHFNIHFKHNFNHVSRSQLYQFVNRHFELGLEDPVLERDYDFLGREDLTVWLDDPGKPAHYREGDLHEREINQVWAADADAAWKRASAKAESGDFSEIGEWVRPGWELILRPEELDSREPGFVLDEKKTEGGVVVMDGLITGGWNAQSISARIHYPESWNGEVVIQAGERGRHEPPGTAPGEGAAVIALDLFGQGEDFPVNASMTYSGQSDLPGDSWQRSPVYFYGYNDSAFVRRVHDLAAAVLMARHHPDWEVKKVTLSGNGPFAAMGLGAKLILGDRIDALEIEEQGFDFGKINDVWDENMVPGAVRYGGVAGLRFSGERQE